MTAEKKQKVKDVVNGISYQKAPTGHISGFKMGRDGRIYYNPQIGCYVAEGEDEKKALKRAQHHHSFKPGSISTPMRRGSVISSDDDGDQNTGPKL